VATNKNAKAEPVKASSAPPILTAQDANGAPTTAAYHVVLGRTAATVNRKLKHL